MHVFVKGRIAASGGKGLADELEANGYEQYAPAKEPVAAGVIPGLGGSGA